MPNFAVALKQEMKRLVRREIKAEFGPSRQAIVQYRREIATLKQLLREQQRKVTALESRGSDAASVEEADEGSPSGLRFSSRSVRAQRRRLGLSAEGYGKLVGVSALTVYNWEKGNTRPRAAQFAALAAIRGIGKREAKERLGTTSDTTSRRKPR